MPRIFANIPSQAAMKSHEKSKLIAANNPITWGCDQSIKPEEGEVKAEPPNAAIAMLASPKEEKASNSDTLSPKHDIVCVSLNPVKVEKKRKDRTPSPSSAKMIIDLTAEEEYETFRLTQLSEKEPVRELNEKESIVYEREMYRSRAWAAPATPAKAPISQDLLGIPSPFARAAFEEKPKKKGEKGSPGEKGNPMLPL